MSGKRKGRVPQRRDDSGTEEVLYTPTRHVLGPLAVAVADEVNNEVDDAGPSVQGGVLPVQLTQVESNAQQLEPAGIIETVTC